MGNKFKVRKKYALEKLSGAGAEGEVDEAMLPVIKLFNSLDGYYTTSTCAGRIVVFHDVGTKQGSTWLGKWHREVEPAEVLDAIKDFPRKGIVWFLHEPSIIHVVCRNLEDAANLLALARESGYKKTGIQSLNDERIIVEICGTERIDAPLAVDGRVIAGADYVTELVALANGKMEKGLLRLKRLEGDLKEVGQKWKERN
ncbi:MAG: hypothetical protein JW724_01610 [Candidatus Altiarchaeota archaeon]|nr:hypothetical protein [Candidatus Altiarchaeota archaeon]